MLIGQQKSNIGTSSIDLILIHFDLESFLKLCIFELLPQGHSKTIVTSHYILSFSFVLFLFLFQEVSILDFGDKILRNCN